MRKNTVKYYKKLRKRSGRYRTLRGGFRDVKDACEQIAKAAGDAAKKKIYRKAVLQFHPDKGGDKEQFQALENCFKKDDAPMQYEPPPAAAPVPEGPEVQVGKVDRGDLDFWESSRPEAKSLIRDFVKTYPDQFFKETLKNVSLLIVYAAKGATRDQIKDTMKRMGLEKPNRKYLFQLIDDTYKPSYPLQKPIAVVTPII